MGVKAKLVTLAFVVILFGFFAGSAVSFDVTSAQPKTTKTVTYDYYVRAGFQIVPTLPDQALVDVDPSGFNFTVDPPVFNLGNTTYWGGRSFLYDGFAYSPYTNMSRFGPPMSGAKVDITNLLGYDITILDLTAEVTDGTITEIFYFSPAAQYFFNWTMVIVDTLDPGEYDEVDYNTGMVENYRLPDGDRYNLIRSGIPPELWDDWAVGYSNQGPGTLLDDDLDGDAFATGHVAPKNNASATPITLANGETFTEHVGVLILGNVSVGTQINGTIQLALTYEYDIPPGYPLPKFTWTPGEPMFNETVTFDATETITYNDTTVQTYAWDFGDGTTGTGMIVDHTYTTPGSYSVYLNVTDTWERSTRITESLKISEPQEELPWIWIGVGIVVVVVVVGVAIFFMRRRK